MDKRMMIRASRTAGLFLATAVLTATAAPGAARAQDTDDRWLPFSGCWQPVGESMADTPAGLLCFRPNDGQSGIQMISLEDGEIVGRETVLADGEQHAADLEGCTGWERASFSARAGRVFLSSEYECDGGVERGSTGLLSMVSTNEWVDVKVVTSGGERLTWVTRYRAALPGDMEAQGVSDLGVDRGMAVRSSRGAGSARPSVEDIIEATQHVDSEGVQAWLAERDARMDLDSKKLVRLADAGVPEDVIDMAIAVSYPERFAIDRETEQYAQPYDAYGGSIYGGLTYGSLFYSPYGFGYGRGYGYGYGGRYGGGYGRPIVIIDSGGSNTEGGRVINGQGYRRSGTSGATRSRPTSSRPAATGSSSGRSSGSTAGRSSGSSSRGTSTGRTARRRGGGGS